jgi:hypothetical protein
MQRNWAVREKIGWETWIRTRIARSRIWSPTVGRSPSSLKTLDLDHTATANCGATGPISAIFDAGVGAKSGHSRKFTPHEVGTEIRVATNYFFAAASDALFDYLDWGSCHDQGAHSMISNGT